MQVGLLGAIPASQVVQKNFANLFVAGMYCLSCLFASLIPYKTSNVPLIASMYIVSKNKKNYNPNMTHSGKVI